MDLNQELYFAHPSTKIKVNKIYNSHYSGSPVWNLFGGAHSLESSYNKSIKVMLDLPLATHRSLIEPLSDERHVKLVLIRRFVGFMEKIDNSGKKALMMLKDAAIKDVRSTTGSNFRNIMLLAGKTCVEDVSRGCLDYINYFKLEEEDKWKVGVIKEIIDVRNGLIDVAGFELEQLVQISDYLCTS